MQHRENTGTNEESATAPQETRGGDDVSGQAAGEKHFDVDESVQGTMRAESERSSDTIEAREGTGTCVLGIVAEPDMPTQIGRRLSDDLTGWLDAHAGGDWSLEVVSAPLAAGLDDRERLLSTVETYRRQRQWAYAICVTDLPLFLAQQRPLLADTSLGRQVALVSLPALGGLQPYRRMRHMLIQLLEELLHTSTEGEETTAAAPGQHRLASKVTNLLAPVHRTHAPAQDGPRYTANRISGWWRLLSGMVRVNRPWQLIFGLSSALAAALATSAFGLSSSTIWQIADAIAGWRQGLAAVFSVALLVFWLITAHGLWERGSRYAHGTSGLAWLYNGSTVLTLTFGVACLYGGLFAINWAVAAFLVPSSILSSTLGHGASWGTYLNLAWGFTTMGTIAGALGSSLESDRAVRQAAYGYREQHRQSRKPEYGI